MSLSRRLPNSNESIWLALYKAKYRCDNLPDYGNILTAKTTLRLQTIYTKYEVSRNELNKRLGISALATKDKDMSVYTLRLMNSHYIQVLNFMIADKIFPATYRTYYRIHINSEAIPNQRADKAVTMLSERIIDGEALMIDAGGKAIPYPELPFIQNGLDLLINKMNFQTNALYDSRETKKKLKALNPEAMGVIKKVWDEVETYFNEESKSSLRVDSRIWGLVYVRSGHPAIITAQIVYMDNTEAILLAGVKVIIVETGETATTDLKGKVKLKSDTSGQVTICFSLDSFEDKIIKREILSDKTVDLGTLIMKRI